MQNKWWEDEAKQMQDLADKNDQKVFYELLRQLSLTSKRYPCQSMLKMEPS